MPAYLGVLALLLVVGAVLVRVQILRRHGVTAMKFGAIDKSDFLIPPFAFCYFYFIWLLEERFLRGHYSAEWDAYASRVRRYF